MRLLHWIGVLALLVLVGGAAFMTLGRMQDCASIPLLAENVLTNAAMQRSAASGLPDGWASLAAGVELRGAALGGDPQQYGFDLNGDGRSIQLIGIANALMLPALDVAPGQVYCARLSALSDTPQPTPTRLRLVFSWQNADNQTLVEQATPWQTAALWRPDNAPRDWALITGRAQAPQAAARLIVRIEPASDDRAYLDAFALRPSLRLGSMASPIQLAKPPAAAGVMVRLWPGKTEAALSFSFDWETAMGGLVHSRSVDDPNSDQDYMLRAMRMRQGVTSTLDIFRPLNIQATYFTNGYSFLNGNIERRTFMGDPTFSWARSTPPYNWKSDRWTSTPWFSSDPYGTVQSDPGWYFGDLLAPLRSQGQDIQSHSFSHMYMGFASVDELKRDLSTWNVIAAEQAVDSARALAFPWSGSAGMADGSWDALEQAGIRTITRTNHSQRQFQLVSADDPRCRPVPGHERILACPDFYLTSSSAAQAPAQIDKTIAIGGVIDFWAHTEEVTSQAQIEAWQRVVSYAAAQRDAGKLWIAPLAQIGERQQAVTALQLEVSLPNAANAPLRLVLKNPSSTNLELLGLDFERSLARCTVSDGQRPVVDGKQLLINVPAGATLNLEVWLLDA